MTTPSEWRARRIATFQERRSRGVMLSTIGFLCLSLAGAAVAFDVPLPMWALILASAAGTALWVVSIRYIRCPSCHRPVFTEETNDPSECPHCGTELR